MAKQRVTKPRQVMRNFMLTINKDFKKGPSQSILRGEARYILGIRGGEVALRRGYYISDFPGISGVFWRDDSGVIDYYSN